MSSYMQDLKQDWLVSYYKPVSPGKRVARTKRFTTKTYSGTNLFYATADEFGCSKNYESPEDAIRTMVYENGCDVIEIKPLFQRIRELAVANNVDFYRTNYGHKVREKATEMLIRDPQKAFELIMNHLTAGNELEDLAKMFVELCSDDVLEEILEYEVSSLPQ